MTEAKQDNNDNDKGSEDWMCGVNEMSIALKSKSASCTSVLRLYFRKTAIHNPTFRVCIIYIYFLFSSVKSVT